MNGSGVLANRRGWLRGTMYVAAGLLPVTVLAGFSLWMFVASIYGLWHYVASTHYDVAVSELALALVYATWGLGGVIGAIALWIAALRDYFLLPVGRALRAGLVVGIVCAILATAISVLLLTPITAPPIAVAAYLLNESGRPIDDVQNLTG